MGSVDTENDGGHGSSPSRRDVLIKGGVAAGVAWSVPVIAGGVARAAGTIPPPPDPCNVCGSNALTNGNASSGLTGWTVVLGSVTTPAYTLAFPPPNAAAPNLYFDMDAGAASTAVRMRQFVDLPAGNVCQGRAVGLTGYYRTATAGTRFSVEVAYFNGNTLLSATSTPLLASLNAWSTFSLNAGTIPANTTRLRIIPNMQQNPNGARGQMDLLRLSIGCI